jgi:hypothetical protein
VDVIPWNNVDCGGGVDFYTKLVVRLVLLVLWCSSLCLIAAAESYCYHLQTITLVPVVFLFLLMTLVYLLVFLMNKCSSSQSQEARDDRRENDCVLLSVGWVNSKCFACAVSWRRKAWKILMFVLFQTCERRSSFGCCGANVCCVFPQSRAFLRTYSTCSSASALLECPTSSWTSVQNVTMVHS